MSEFVKDNILEKLRAEPKNLWKRLLVTAVVIAIVIWGSTSITYNGITDKGATIAINIIRGILNPETATLFNFGPNGVPYLVLETMAIAVLGTVIGALLAVPVSFLASTNIVPKPVAMIFRALIMLIRTIPSLVWALVWVRVTGPGPFCGVVTQSVCSIGMISKMYITAIENLDTGVRESLDALGCNTFEKIRCGVIPQLMASFVSTAIYRFDINLKDATTLGIVGAGGIGFPLQEALGSGKWKRVGSFLLVLIIVVLVFEWISNQIRNRLARGRS